MPMISAGNPWPVKGPAMEGSPMLNSNWGRGLVKIQKRQLGK
jgi:hypothetical protein